MSVQQQKTMDVQMTPDDKKEPVGKRIRDLVYPALDDERRPEIQKKILNNIFNRVAGALPDILEGDLDNFSRQLEHQTRRDPNMKNPLIIEALTNIDPRTGESLFNPIKKIPLPLSVAFTQFSADDVKYLSGYIKLHEAARDVDVSIRVLGLTADESKAGAVGYALPALLIIDGTKSYTEGALENSNLYPDLPPKKEPFDGRGPKSFKL